MKEDKKILCKNCKSLASIRCGLCRPLDFYDSPVTGKKEKVDKTFLCDIKNGGYNCKDFSPTLWYRIKLRIRKVFNR